MEAWRGVQEGNIQKFREFRGLIINGIILKVIYHLYDGAKSCVKMNGKLSDSFKCNIGWGKEKIWAHYCLQSFLMILNIQLAGNTLVWIC